MQTYKTYSCRKIYLYMTKVKPTSSPPIHGILLKKNHCKIFPDLASQQADNVFRLTCRPIINPYKDHSNLIQLSKLIGVNVGVNLHSRFSYTQIIDLISDNMKSNLHSSIRSMENNIFALMDESTTNLQNLQLLSMWGLGFIIS